MTHTPFTSRQEASEQIIKKCLCKPSPMTAYHMMLFWGKVSQVTCSNCHCLATLLINSFVFSASHFHALAVKLRRRFLISH